MAHAKTRTLASGRTDSKASALFLQVLPSLSGGAQRQNCEYLSEPFPPEGCCSRTWEGVFKGQKNCLFPFSGVQLSIVSQCVLCGLSSLHPRLAPLLSLLYPPAGLPLTTSHCPKGWLPSDATHNSLLFLFTFVLSSSIKMCPSLS